MRRKSFAAWAVAVVCIMLAVWMTGCTVTVRDPSITEEIELQSVQIQAENMTWQTLEQEQAQKMVDTMRSLGELSNEPLNIGVAGQFRSELQYDYTFRIQYSAGNFLKRKKGDFTYGVGETLTRIWEDGTRKSRYEEKKLVSSTMWLKHIATLSDGQMQVIRDIFEPINVRVMTAAFEQVAAKAKESGYMVEELSAETLPSIVMQQCGSMPNFAEQNLLRGYCIYVSGTEHYVFLTASLEWAKKMEQQSGTQRVGRVCYPWIDGYSDTIRNILMS